MAKEYVFSIPVEIGVCANSKKAAEKIADKVAQELARADWPAMAEDGYFLAMYGDVATLDVLRPQFIQES